MDQLQTAEADAAFKDYWDNFRFSRTRIVTRPAYLYVVALLPYVTLLVAAIIADLSGKTEFKWTKEAITLWPMLIGTAFLLMAIWAYNRWREEISVFFSWLFDGGRIASQEGDLEQQYRQYLREYQRKLLSFKGPLLFMVVFMIFVVVFNWIAKKPQGIVEYWGMDDAYGRFVAIRWIILWFFGFSIWAIVFGFIAWTIYVTGRQLTALSDRFDAVVQPTHPDQCDGLKPWGEFCFNMTLPLVIAGVLLAIFGMGYSILTDMGVDVTPTVVPMANAALFLVVVSLTGVSFYAPVSGVHRRMVQIKKAFEDQYGSRAAVLEEQIKANLDDPEGLADAKQAAEELSLVRALVPNDYSYPEWPFDRSMPVILFISPVLSLALQFLVDLFSQSNCCG